MCNIIFSWGANMFDNIGGKIKTLAEVVALIGIVASVFVGVLRAFSISVIRGILFAVVGSLASWIGSFFAYGFGELIEKTCLIEERLSNNGEISTQTPKHNADYRSGEIETEE